MVVTTSPTDTRSDVPDVSTLRWLSGMVPIRDFEERIAALRQSGALQGSAHLHAGQEVAVGVCARLNVDDYVASTHRGHGHAIAKGIDVARMMAEFYILPGDEVDDIVWTRFDHILARTNPDPRPFG
jgi:TPP-dependent pyruvate/acetoin dehydrogenase alpha subunit